MFGCTTTTAPLRCKQVHRRALQREGCASDDTGCCAWVSPCGPYARQGPGELAPHLDGNPQALGAKGDGAVGRLDHFHSLVHLQCAYCRRHADQLAAPRRSRRVNLSARERGQLLPPVVVSHNFACSPHKWHGTWQVAQQCTPAFEHAASCWQHSLQSSQGTAPSIACCWPMLSVAALQPGPAPWWSAQALLVYPPTAMLRAETISGRPHHALPGPPSMASARAAQQ